MAEHGLSLRLSGVFKRAIRAEKLIALALLFVLLSAAILGVTSVLKGPDWASLWKSLLFGLLLGWALALWRRPAGQAALIAVVFGVLYILLFPGGFWGKLIPPISEVIRLGWQSVTSSQGAKTDLSPLVHSLMELSTSSGVVIERIRAWMAALVSRQPAFDPVAAALVWSLLAWIVAAWAGWVVEARRSALLAVLPALLLSTGTLSYGRRMSFALYLMLGAMLLLLATVQHERREQGWVKTGVAYPKEKGRQIGLTALLVTVVLVLLRRPLALDFNPAHQRLDIRAPPARRAAGQPVGRISWHHPWRDPHPGRFRNGTTPGPASIPFDRFRPRAFAAHRHDGLRSKPAGCFWREIAVVLAQFHV